MTYVFIVGGFDKTHEKFGKILFSRLGISIWIADHQIIMRINSYCIFSESSSLSSATKSSPGKQMSILRDLDPGAAKFPQGGGAAKSRGFLWGGALLMLAGGAAWLLISTQREAVLHASTSLGQEGKVEALNLLSLEKSDERNSIKPLVSDAKVAVAAPAVIREGGGASGLVGLKEDQSASVPADIKSAGVEKDVLQPLPVPVAGPFASSRADGGGRSTKKIDLVSRLSPSAIVSAKGKDGGAQSSRAVQREKPATERDIDIITVLVK